jgi:uncharacterized protein
MISDEIIYYGHPNVLGLHPRAIEITKDSYLTKSGDCIIGINSNKGCSDIDTKLKKLMQDDEIKIKFEFIVEGSSFEVFGRGNKNLTLENKNDIVIRTTNFVCPRTVSVRCNRGSNNIPREIISYLQKKNTKGFLRISVDDY